MRIVNCLAGAALGLLAASGLLSASHAAPPTVVPSPGYDARLQEQRAAQRAASPADATARPPAFSRHPRAHRHRTSRRHVD